jgi:hypothetical protein
MLGLPRIGSGRALRSACSCLNLILACIVYWQACEISRVLSECDPIANGIDLSLLEHVSPRSSIKSGSKAAPCARSFRLCYY